MLAEQETIASIEERIRQEQNLAKNMAIAAIISIIFTAVGFGVNLTPYGGVVGQFGFGYIGMIGFFLCYAVEYNANQRRKKLIKKLADMTVKVSTCVKCGKQIPKGNFTFCPFCGSALTPPI